MAYFKDLDNAIISKVLQFQTITEDTINQFETKTGQRAGFKIQTLSVPGYADLLTSQIYDCSGVEAVNLGTISVVDGMDLTGGYFTSGCFVKGNPLEEDAEFYLVDYV